jgi:flagellar export protein FliJ
MRRFEFRLDRFLKLRRAETQKKLIEFAAEQEKLRQEARRLELFVQEQETQLTAMKELAQKPFAAWLRSGDWKYLGRLERVTDYQRGRVATQHDVTIAARSDYVEARTRVKSLEQLRETKEREWRGTEIASEQKLLDDIPREISSIESEQAGV